MAVVDYLEAQQAAVLLIESIPVTRMSGKPIRSKSPRKS